MLKDRTLDIKSQYAKNILKIRFKERQQIESLKASGMSVEQQGQLEYIFNLRVKGKPLITWHKLEIE